MTPEGIVAAFDQEGAVMRQYATLLGTYWSALLAEGIPEEVAEMLLRDFQRLRVFSVEEDD